MGKVLMSGARTRGARTQGVRPGRSLLALAACGTLLLAGCGGGDIASGPASGVSAACTTTMDMAVNPWVGYEASAHVVGRVVEQKLGCQVEYKALKEEVAWQGFGTDVDVVIEDWGHPALEEKYIDGANPTAVDGGPNGNIGQIGWFVPPWMVEEYPDILDWQNLNKYADLFTTSESGGQGQLLDGDPSFVTNDEALVKNNKLDFKVVYAGSEAALITAFRQAEANKTPLIGYFYSPQWFLSEVDLQKVALPAYTDGCDADPETITCDYPETTLKKIIAKDFVDENSPAYQVVKNFTWTNEDQNLVAKYIAEDKMSADDAADKWIADNEDTVAGWLPK